MFHNVAGNNSDFNRQGSLKTIITFKASVEVKSITVRQKATWKGDGEEPRQREFFLSLEDDYGAVFSYFRRNMSLETAQTIAAKIPYGRTIILDGEICIRKGNTYLNIERFKNPDDTDILLFPIEGDEKDEITNRIYA